MSLLTLIQRVADYVSVPRPSVVVNSSDQLVRTLFAIAQEEGDDLCSSFRWAVLTQEKTFTTTATAVQTGAVPTDLDRFVPNSFFNRTTRRQVFGPITPQEWQAIQAQPALARVYLAFRERDGDFLITPTPAAGQTIAYEYVSNYWAKAVDGTPKPAFTADTDTTYLSESLMALGMRWRWLKSRGLEYGEDLQTYERQKEQVQARDGGAGRISLTGDGYYGINVNLPEGGFPGPG